MARILGIDDDDEILALLRIYLEREGHEFIAARGSEQGVNLLNRIRPDLIITDIIMPGLTGGEIYEYIRLELGPQVPVIISTGTNLKFRPNGDPMVAISPKQDDYSGLMELVAEMLGKATGAPDRA